MPLALIRGNYRIVGASPDGDSVRFYPDDRGAFGHAGLRVRTNLAGGAQLRLDGIDALETHYRPPVSGGGLWRQPAALGDAAASELLAYLGFRSVSRDAAGTVTAAEPEQAAGYIMTRFADKYGRAVAFAFPGRPARRSDSVHLDVATMMNSVNYHQLKRGLAYPTFYSKLYPDLRQAMAEAAIEARSSQTGLWKANQTPGFRLRSRRDLAESLVILPKLFRRLVDYLSLDESGGVSLVGFSHYLDVRDDRLFTIPNGHMTELHTLVGVRRQEVRLGVQPERIVFLEA